MSQKFQVFIGYDPRQPLAYNVAAHSLVSRASRPVSVTRLQLNQLPMTRRGLTEFTYSRFLVPLLSDFDGYSLFVDADVLVRADVFELLTLPTLDRTAAVSVVPHEGAMAFERASVMLFNNKRCTNVTRDFVEDTANSLFDLRWASKIGSLPAAWNHLVGYNAPTPDPKIVHFTKGIPCWSETRDVEWGEAWVTEHRLMNGTCAFQELMGGSVHVQRGPLAAVPLPAGQVMTVPTGRP